MVEQQELSLTQAAAFFGVSTDTLKDTLIPQYSIPYRKDKRRYFFLRHELIRIQERMYEDKSGKT
jgi:hypothetical protein